MADSLYDLLLPQLGGLCDNDDAALPPAPTANNVTSKYLNRLTTLSLDAVLSTEPQSLSQTDHSNLASLQALAHRSHKAFIHGADNLSHLRTSLPVLIRATHSLQDVIPNLDSAAVRFATTYARHSTEPNETLERRRESLLLARNMDRVCDILELPTLLSTAVSPSSSAHETATPGSATPGQTQRMASGPDYSSALDLHAHIKRLQSHYPTSPLVRDVAQQAEGAIREMTTNLLVSLRGKNLRLAATMRTMGWLRRVAPELELPKASSPTDAGSDKTITISNAPHEGAYGALFLVCRLANLLFMLDALRPLQELADMETQKRLSLSTHINNKQLRRRRQQQQQQQQQQEPLKSGQQTERFLKRYIEVFREQSFAIISLYRNLFPDSDTSTASSTFIPSALATFPFHVASLLTDTVKEYLPNITDHAARESLLTQVLYCASSMGRLGANFGLMIADIIEEGDDSEDEDEDDDDDGDEKQVGNTRIPEWEEVMRKHRALAARLHSLTTTA